MPTTTEHRQQRREGFSLLSGVIVGTVAILTVFSVTSIPFSFSLGTPASGSLTELGCTAGQCVNVSIGFSGRTSIDPAALRISIKPVDPSIVVNQTAGVPLNLSFIVTATPHWLGNLGGGTYTSNFEGDVVDPGGQIVGYGGPTTIHSGAVLCLKGAHTPTSEDYDLIFSYHGTIASVVVTFA